MTLKAEKKWLHLHWEDTSPQGSSEKLESK